MMPQTIQEHGLYAQGFRDGINGAVHARDCREHPEIVYRDGWRAGMLKRVLKETRNSRRN